jgi:hypothetical protein
MLGLISRFSVMRGDKILIVWSDKIMCFNRLQNRESGISMEDHLSDSEDQRVFIGTSERMHHFAKWMREGFLRWMSSYFPVWCSNKFKSMQLWFLTGFPRARQNIRILSFFHPKMYSIETNMCNWWSYQHAARQEEPNCILLRVKIKLIFVVWFIFHLWQMFSRNKFKKNMTSEIELLPLWTEYIHFP